MSLGPAGDPWWLRVRPPMGALPARPPGLSEPSRNLPPRRGRIRDGACAGWRRRAVGNTVRSTGPGG